MLTTFLRLKILCKCAIMLGDTISFRKLYRLIKFVNKKFSENNTTRGFSL